MVVGALGHIVDMAGAFLLLGFAWHTWRCGRLAGIEPALMLVERLRHPGAVALLVLGFGLMKIGAVLAERSGDFPAPSMLVSPATAATTTHAATTLDTR